MGNIILGLVICLVIFFLCREINCWYWKLNRIVELLESIDRKLEPRRTLKSPKLESTLKPHTSTWEVKA